MTPKDVILELLRRRGVRGGLGRVFEFYGPGVANIDVTGRTTICNMIAELGATAGIFPSDERTREWLEMQQRPDDFVELSADEGADYDEHEHIELDKLEPLIAKPHSPGNVVPVSEVAGTKAAQVCIGSSVNSGFQDLAVAAAVLRDETVYPGLVMTVTPGAARSWTPSPRPACTPTSCGPGADARAGVRSVRRDGPGAALGGREREDVQQELPGTFWDTDGPGLPHEPDDGGGDGSARRHHRPARAREYPELPEAPANPAVDDRQILEPAPEDEASGIEIPRGPNIKPPPEAPELPDSLEATVTIVVDDDISTGDLAPDGGGGHVVPVERPGDRQVHLPPLRPRVPQEG